MIHIAGNDLMRGGEKIGWLEGNDVYDRDGTKLGFYTSNDIYDISGKKVGYIQGNYIFGEGGHKIRVDDNRTHITGGAYPDLTRAAIRLLLGD